MALSEYTVVCKYHTHESVETKVIASSPEQAREIAEYKFRKHHTESCIFDYATVLT